MVARKLLVVALAATLLIGGVAATGAASVQDAQPDDQDDRISGDAAPSNNSTEYDDGGNGSVADRGNGSAADRGNGSAPSDVGPDGERGPPTDMPANVPDHVVQIHQTINQFLNGDVDNLGNALSELLGGEDAGEDEEAENEDAAENESEEADEADDADDDSDEADDAEEADDDADDDADDTDADADDDDEAADA